MKNILVITPFHFHNKIGYAGGKTVNYYVNRFSNEFEITVLSTDDKNDDSLKMVHDNPQINFILNDKKKNLIQNLIDHILFNYCYKILKLFSPYYSISNGFIKRRLKYLLQKIEHPGKIDIVIAEFTQIIFQIKVIKDIFPNAKLIASCHDVTFQSIERKLNYKKIHFYKNVFLKEFKKIEKSKLTMFDLIVVQSMKDKILLTELDFSENLIQVIVPSYDTYIVKQDRLNSLVFLGHMKREENREAVIWFLENVWINLKKKLNKELKFYIIGGGITDSFKKYVDNYPDVELTGFVNNPAAFLQNAYAMIVPLQTGAGIKVKTIEGFASGIPIISNEIGVEGIPVSKNIDYLHCEKENEWEEAIKNIIEDEIFRITLIYNAKAIVNNHFNLDDSFNNYRNKIMTILNN